MAEEKLGNIKGQKGDKGEAGGIAESGGNEEIGYYTKFEDGLVIIQMNDLFISDIATNSYLRQSFAFPTALPGHDYAVSILIVDSTYNWRKIRYAYCRQKRQPSIQIGVVGDELFTDEKLGITLDVTITGRWK